MGAAKFLIILFCLLAGGSLAQEYRLSKNIIPDLYDIHIKPYLRLEDGDKQFTFDGEVNVTLHAVVDNLKEITLHKDLINMLDVILYDANGGIVQNIDTESMVYVAKTHKLTIKLSTSLVLDKSYTLYFKYRGQIGNGKAGFYKASYDNVK